MEPINAVPGTTPKYFTQQRVEMLPFVPDKALKIIEVGCGAGTFSSQLRRPDRELWGIEYDATAANEATRVLDHVLCGDANILLAALPTAYFECAIFNDVLEHLVDPYGLLNNLKHNLTSDSVVVASIPNVRYWWHVRDYLFKGEWRYKDYGILDRTHLRFFTASSIREMFEDAGFEVISLKGIHGFHSWKFSLLNNLLMGKLSDMRYEQFACVARPRPTLAKP